MCFVVHSNQTFSWLKWVVGVDLNFIVLVHGYYDNEDVHSGGTVAKVPIIMTIRIRCCGFRSQLLLGVQFIVNSALLNEMSVMIVE